MPPQNYSLFHPQSSEDTFPSLQKWLGHQPDLNEVLRAAKQLYTLGSATNNETHDDIKLKMTGAQPAGRHLLAYCFLQMNTLEKAFREFKHCVKEGMAEDWQLLVELAIEMESPEPPVQIDRRGSGDTENGYEIIDTRPNSSES